MPENESPPMTFPRRKSRAQIREALYDRCRGEAEHPSCNLCGLAVLPFDAWEESHTGAPKAFGGTVTGVAHKRCNREHGQKVVTPAAAEARRVRRKFIGAQGPGMGPRPMQGGRNSPLKKKMSGEVVKRHE